MMNDGVGRSLRSMLFVLSLLGVSGVVVVVVVVVIASPSDNNATTRIAI
jgi:hypothetical protein